jgi:hypothetical protein
VGGCLGLLFKRHAAGLAGQMGCRALGLGMRVLVKHERRALEQGVVAIA